jgi:hypothetical protein
MDKQKKRKQLKRSKRWLEKQARQTASSNIDLQRQHYQYLK